VKEIYSPPLTSLGKEKCIWELMHSIRILGEKNLISGVKYFNFKVEAGGMYL
jgi:hypothetical protein